MWRQLFRFRVHNLVRVNNIGVQHKLRPGLRLLSLSPNPALSEDARNAKIQTMNELVKDALKYQDYSKATTLSQSVCELSLEGFGHDHPAHASALNNLAVVLKQQGKAEQAIQIFEEAFLIYEKLLGKEHPSTLATSQNLAIALRAAGKLQQSFELFVDVGEQYSKLLGTTTDQNVEAIADVYVVLKARASAIQLELNNPAEAEWHAWRALTRVLEVMNENSLPAAKALHNLGSLFIFTHQFQKAKVLLDKSLAIRQQILPDGHPAIVAVQEALKSLSDIEKTVH